MAAWKVAVLSLLALAMSADMASARKRFRMPLFVPIPGVASSAGETVKVLELPDTPLLRRPDGRYIDLGYRHARSGPSSWVGYVGSSREYLPLSESALRGLMLVAGLNELPPVPKRGSGSSGSGGMLALLVVAGALGFGILKKVVFGAGRTVTRAAETLSNSASGSETPDWVSRAEHRVATGEVSTDSPIRRPSMRPAMASHSAAGSGGRATFGRRA